MSEERKVVCDTCARDLTTTGNCVDYRLVVASQTIPGWGGAVTAMMIYPPVDRTYHFCGLGCLREHAIATGNAVEAQA